MDQAAQALRDALLKPDNSTKSQHFFFANGQQLGSFGQLTGENGQFKASFDVNFTPVSQAYPSSVPSQVIAQSGDTQNGHTTLSDTAPSTISRMRR